MSSEIQAILFSLLSAVVGFIVVFFQVKTKEQKAKLEKIEDEQKSHYAELKKLKKDNALKKLYTRCPQCDTEIDLTTVEIYEKEGDENAKL